MLEDDPSQSDLGDGDLFADGLVEPDAETVDQPPGIESQLLVARALARFGNEDERTPVVVGRYRITRRLGAGAMGMVFAGYDDALAREVAIKLLQTRLATSEDSRQRLLREAQAMARLSHPNVAHVYEVGEHEGRFFIAMELVAGSTMRQWHRERERGVVEIVDMHLQAARGLAAAHDVDLVHRDYKPDNVMIDDHGRARVMDFGLARHTGDVHPTSETRASSSFPSASASGAGAVPSPLMVDATATGTVMGTPAYMAPEQMLGRRIDHRADQFAFCVALFEALHGHRPFAGTTSEAVLDSIGKRRFRSEGRTRGIPRGLEAMVRRGLSLDPAERFPSMHALADALEGYGSRAGLRGLARRGGAWAAAALLVGGGVAIATWDRDATAAAEPATIATMDAPAADDPWQAIVDASDLPTPHAEPLPDDPTHVTVHRLRNGLTVYLAPRPGVPSIDTAVVVRADATDERAGEAGSASLLQAVIGDSDRLGSGDPVAEAPLLAREHEALRTLARATDDAKRSAALAEAIVARNARDRLTIDGDMSWLAEHIGLSTHALELGPGTVWTRTVPGNRMAAWASMLAEALRRPAFRGYLAQIHAEVEGRRSKADDALAIATARALVEPTGRTLDTLTAIETLRRYPFDATEQFWRAHYVPNNVAIVLVGEVSAAETLPVIEAAFGDWEPAALPTRHVPPIATAGRGEIVDDEAPTVVRAWPRRDGVDDIAAVEDFLAASGFAARWLEQDGRARWVPYSSDPWILELVAAPTEGHTLDDAEAALAAMLDALADGPIDDAAIASARAQAELSAAIHASSSYDLSLLVAQSFATRTQWQDHLARVRGDGLDRAAIARGAAALRERGGVVVRRTKGAASRADIPPSPILPPRPEGMPAPSQYSAALAAAPVSRLEPQFLLAGRSFTEHTRGAGRVVAVEHDVPMFELDWIVPVGVAEDPWICDAWRAREIDLRPLAEPIGASLTVTCGVHTTTVHLTAVARRRDESWPLLDAIAQPELSREAAAAHLATIVPARRFVREHDDLVVLSFAVVAMRGEQGVDAHMPDDATVARADPSVLVDALARGAVVDPDVLVATPRADAFAASLLERIAVSTTSPARRPIPLLGPRALDRTTVFVLDDPARTRADVRAVRIVPLRDVHTRVGLDAFFNVETPRLPTGSAAAHVYSWPRPRSYAGRTTFGIVAVECVSADVAMFAGALVDVLQATPAADALRQALVDVELDLRATRRLGMTAARDVWSWPQLGDGRGDPALADWTTLTEVDADDLLALHARIVAEPLVVSIVADLDAVDTVALAKVGTIVRVPTGALRDAMLTDTAMFGVLDH